MIRATFTGGKLAAIPPVAVFALSVERSALPTVALADEGVAELAERGRFVPEVEPDEADIPATTGTTAPVNGSTAGPSSTTGLPS